MLARQLIETLTPTATTKDAGIWGGLTEEQRRTLRRSRQHGSR
ncbi:MAG: hypothetical protein ACRDYA_14390 [Egibacteraceae bacterium]